MLETTAALHNITAAGLFQAGCSLLALAAFLLIFVPLIRRR